jgi:hypothetical protein
MKSLFFSGGELREIFFFGSGFSRSEKMKFSAHGRERGKTQTNLI